MSTSLNLQNSIAFAQGVIKNHPVFINGLEPAITSGNIILQTMLGAPFKWRWNRSTFSISLTIAGGTDYVVAVADLGSIETMWLKDTQNNILQLSGAVALAKASDSGRPTRVAAQYDDGLGNITFRFDRIPDANYTANFDYQRKPSLITSPASPWGVVSDEFGYIYNYGFLCLLMLLNNDSRFPIFEQYFVSRLLGAQDGLTDQERNIFLGMWLKNAQTVTRDQAAVNMGVAGRGK